NGVSGMQQYAELFKENHITGKRLLLLTETDMRELGVKSKGHIMHLKGRTAKTRDARARPSIIIIIITISQDDEIVKLTNDYLGLVQFPPLFKDESEEKVEQRKTVYLELVFGYHWKPGTGDTVSQLEQNRSGTL
ncbi:hypothetical protein CRUP_012505, partial [Coryphaenoides rupestris]